MQVKLKRYLLILFLMMISTQVTAQELKFSFWTYPEKVDT